MFPLGKQATVYQAEVYAILMCAVLLSNSVNSVIFVNENENENYQKRKNNDFVNEN